MKVTNMKVTKPKYLTCPLFCTFKVTDMLNDKYMQLHYQKFGKIGESSGERAVIRIVKVLGQCQKPLFQTIMLKKNERTEKKPSVCPTSKQ